MKFHAMNLPITQEQLENIDQEFIKRLKEADEGLCNALITARNNSAIQDYSQLMLDVAPYLDEYVIELFGLHNDSAIKEANYARLYKLLDFKRQFVQKIAIQAYAKITYTKKELLQAQMDLQNIGIDLNDDWSFYEYALRMPDQESFKLYAHWATTTEDGQSKHKSSLIFKAPKKTNYAELLSIKRTENLIESTNQIFEGEHDEELYLSHISPEHAAVNVHYCIICHPNKKDSCSHGICGESGYKHNEAGAKLMGCPLREDISQMNAAKAKGLLIAPLAIAMVGNPMLLATGHRICNDCMKSCIYQKQTPVNVPVIESAVLNDVLSMPYGFEIYNLLLHWNPLNVHSWVRAKPNGKSVLIAGAGPAGFTFAYYMLHMGYDVTLIEAQKVEPLPLHVASKLISSVLNLQEELFEKLSERRAWGFGGVMEYGITDRWNKNYLTLIRLVLERNQNFKLYGSVRIGGNLTIAQAWEVGFNHIALALGAGAPNVPARTPGILAGGVRTASELLMSLQSGGARLDHSMFAMLIRLPCIVIGGGLTAVDAACEVISYYETQVMKYTKICEVTGYKPKNQHEAVILEEFQKHASRFAKANTKAEKMCIINEAGGVTIVYRRGINESPSYKMNHEELQAALDSGIKVLEGVTVDEVLTGEDGSCIGVRHAMKIIPAHSVIIATGTKPNHIIFKEDEELQEGYVAVSAFEDSVVVKRYEDGRTISMLGDMHPRYAGSVVKAMSSAKHAADELRASIIGPNVSNKRNLDEELEARVIRVEEIAPNVIEILVKAPLAARNFRPGQFFKLQRYNSHVIDVHGFDWSMEPIALTGADVVDKDMVSLIVLLSGASSKLCKYIKPGEVVSLMGPTGTKSHIPRDKQVLLVGGGLGNAVLFSIGKAMREEGCNVLYFAGYRRVCDIYKVQKIMQAADKVVWCVEDSTKGLDEIGAIGEYFCGNVVEGLRWYAGSKGGFNHLDEVLVIGSDGMMSAVTAELRYGAERVRQEARIIASINSPMQCMMKEICGQCLQLQIDPFTREPVYVFSCNTQDQDARFVDFDSLKCRLSQNTLQEALCLSLTQ